jgi:D-aspartate ligase
MRTSASRPITAVVMNLFYTGLGIARSLGEHGIPVIGLSAQRGVYGNFSRYAKTVRCADSRKDPETLLTQLTGLGARLGHRAVLFPTRDHDLVFLDRFRRELEPYFVLVVASREALERCLNKWDTYCLATQAGVPTPKSWLVEDAEDLRKAAGEVAYPCVLKPVAAHHWRTADNWALVGGRKAIAVASAEQLLAEYAVIAGADPRALVQEAIPGADDCLIVTACYIDRQSRFQAAFNIQKLVQTPPGFGTGCIVQSANRPELLDRTIRLLQAMEFTGVAEVEYKWDARDNEYKLIEVNPRPWDQHRVGAAGGVDLMYLAYCDCAGLPKPALQVDLSPRKWVAEDAFILTALRLLWRRERGIGALVRQARGERVYAIWSATDPLPFIAYVASLIPELGRMGLQRMRHVPADRAAARQKTAMRASQ